MGLSQVQIRRNLVQAYGQAALLQPQIQMWFHRFQTDPNRSCQDEPHTGHPRSARTLANVEKVQQAVQQDRRRSIKTISEAVGTSATSTQRILKKDLHLRHIAPKFIPRILTEQQKAMRLQICQDNIWRIQRDACILDRIITTDESWVFKFDPNTKQADMQWVGPQDSRPTKAIRSKSQQKCMLCLFFDARGVIFMEFLDRDERLNSDLYIALLCRMREAVRRKRPDLWRDWSFFLHQDNAPCHVSTQLLEYFHNVDLELWPHTPLQPGLGPVRFLGVSCPQETDQGYPV